MDRPMRNQASDSKIADENVVQRLRRRTQQARDLGFHVRTELLDGQEPSWCMIGKRKTIFIDLAQTAAEQLRQLEESMSEYQQRLRKSRESMNPAA
tara:strand:- start:8452 stop:8739 length:288 start_codon:yes stop_codon:yes gene_type:complete